MTDQIQSEPTYTHAEVRRMMNELSASAKAYGLEVVSTLTGPGTADLGLRRIEPQPAADERVAEHMRLAEVMAGEFLDWNAKTGSERAYDESFAAVESSARALLAAGREDAEHAAMWRLHCDLYEKTTGVDAAAAIRYTRVKAIQKGTP